MGRLYGGQLGVGEKEEDIVTNSLWERGKALALRYKELLLYVIFGGLTTLVNILTYLLCTKLLHVALVPANLTAWILSVLFAYVTNKLFVFESKAWSGRLLLREFVSFVGARIVSGLFDMAFLYVTVEYFHIWDVPMKIVSNILVIVMNFVFSKLIVFRKKEVHP